MKINVKILDLKRNIVDKNKLIVFEKIFQYFVSKIIYSYVLSALEE